MLIGIGPHGRLHQWIDEDDVVSTDITYMAPYYTFYPICTILDGATLRDILLILREHIDVYKLIINNWVEELVAEGLDNPPGKTDMVLELYFEPDGSFPGLHGLSDGQEWAVEFTPVYELVDCPIKTDGTNYPLGTILFSIIWELGFMGPPSERDAIRSRILNDLEKAILTDRAGTPFRIIGA